MFKNYKKQTRLAIFSGLGAMIALGIAVLWKITKIASKPESTQHPTVVLQLNQTQELVCDLSKEQEHLYPIQDHHGNPVGELIISTILDKVEKTLSDSSSRQCNLAKVELSEFRTTYIAYAYLVTTKVAAEVFAYLNTACPTHWAKDNSEIQMKTKKGSRKAKIVIKHVQMTKSGSFNWVTLEITVK